MQYFDHGHEEMYNVRVYDGGGDTGYIWEVTRLFTIYEQSELGYVLQMKPGLIDDMLTEVYGDKY